MKHICVPNKYTTALTDCLHIVYHILIPQSVLNFIRRIIDTSVWNAVLRRNLAGVILLWSASRLAFQWCFVFYIYSFFIAIQIRWKIRLLSSNNVIATKLCTWHDLWHLRNFVVVWWAVAELQQCAQRQTYACSSTNGAWRRPGANYDPCSRHHWIIEFKVQGWDEVVPFETGGIFDYLNRHRVSDHSQ